MDAITVDHLSFSYEPGREILHDLSFSVTKGETVVIAGLSGCGKTTLCQILCGIIPRSIKGDLTGEVRLMGEPIAGKNAAALAQSAALVFQDSDNQLICTTVEDELAFGPENLARPPQAIARRLDKTLARYQLTSLRRRDPASLSGGEKKLAALAAVTMLDPAIVILDEPLSGLDESGRELVGGQIAALKAAGQTVLLVEHDLGADIARRSDRWLILAGGRIVAYEPPPQLLAGRLLYDLELCDD